MYRTALRPDLRAFPAAQAACSISVRRVASASSRSTFASTPTASELASRCSSCRVVRGTCDPTTTSAPPLPSIPSSVGVSKGRSDCPSSALMKDAAARNRNFRPVASTFSSPCTKTSMSRLIAPFTTQTPPFGRADRIAATRSGPPSRRSSMDTLATESADTFPAVFSCTHPRTSEDVNAKAGSRANSVSPTGARHSPSDTY